MSAPQTEATVWHIGGSDVHMRVPLLLQLRERGFHVGAVGSANHALFAEHGIPFRHYPLTDIANPFSDWMARRSLIKLFKSHKPDVIHAFDTRPALIAPIAARAAEVPCRIRTITGMGRLFSAASVATLPLRQSYRFLQRRVSKSCVTVFQNQDDQQYFRTYRMVNSNNDALVAGSGIDLEKITAAANQPSALQKFRAQYQLNDKFVITMTARLIWQKGVREYLNAAAKIAKQYSDIAFLLVGPLHEEGRNAISLSEIQSYAPAVQYLGSRDDIPTILSATDVFALPSYYREGVPRVLLEAGAMSLPLITTNAPGCRDVVRHEQEGLIVPTRSSNAIAQAVLRFYNNRELCERCGHASRQRVEKQFSLSQVADAYAEIYRKSLMAA